MRYVIDPKHARTKNHKLTHTDAWNIPFILIAIITIIIFSTMKQQKSFRLHTIGCIVFNWTIHLLIIVIIGNGKPTPVTFWMKWQKSIIEDNALGAGRFFFYLLTARVAWRKSQRIMCFMPKIVTKTFFFSISVNNEKLAIITRRQIK